MRKPLMVLAILVLLVLAVLGALLPVLQGWVFLILALYLLATEFEGGRAVVRGARRRWPVLSRWSPPPAPIAGRRAICTNSTT